MKTRLLIFLIALMTSQIFCQWQTVNIASFSNDAGTSNTRIAAHDNNIYVAFRHNSWKLNVIKFDGNSWSYLGGPEITPAQVGPHVDIKVNSNNIPYVVYKDNNTPNQKLSVIRYVSNNWESVGNNFFTPGIANNPKITFDKNNVPYIVYSDFVDNKYKLSVMKFNGTSWNLVGNRGFTEDASYTTIITDNNNTPYIAFNSTSNGNAGKTSVMKFNGTNWEFVGNEGFSSGYSRNHSLAIDSHNIIHLAYHASGTNGGSSNVLKFNGSAWEHIGNPGMGFYATEQELFIDKNDNIYLSYTETTKNEISVRRFNGTNWELVGNSPVAIGNFSDVIKNDKDEVYVAYTGNTSLDIKKISDVVLSTNTFYNENFFFSAYPNPASNFITFSSNLKINKIEIFSTLGKRVLQKIATDLNNKTIDVSRLKSGIYLVRINQNGFKKIIIK